MVCNFPRPSATAPALLEHKHVAAEYSTAPSSYGLTPVSQNPCGSLSPTKRWTAQCLLGLALLTLPVVPRPCSHPPGWHFRLESLLLWTGGRSRRAYYQQLLVWQPQTETAWLEAEGWHRCWLLLDWVLLVEKNLCVALFLFGYLVKDNTADNLHVAY